jgi:predicted metal-dependent enzyme (double-stranded beta helix superfamily)
VNRDAACLQAVERAAALCAARSPEDPPLGVLRELVAALARRRECFDPGSFALPAGESGRLYELAVAAGGPALYLATSRPGSRQPPHAHCTWAVIAGVDGAELNTVYAPDPEPLRRGPGRLIERGRFTIAAGDALALGPEDFHALEIPAGARSFHLHLYGRALDRLEHAWFFEDGEFRARRPRPAVVRPAA